MTVQVDPVLRTQSPSVANTTKALSYGACLSPSPLVSCNGTGCEVYAELERGSIALTVHETYQVAPLLLLTRFVRMTRVVWGRHGRLLRV